MKLPFLVLNASPAIFEPGQPIHSPAKSKICIFFTKLQNHIPSFERPRLEFGELYAETIILLLLVPTDKKLEEK